MKLAGSEGDGRSGVLEVEKASTLGLGSANGVVQYVACKWKRSSANITARSNALLKRTVAEARFVVLQLRSDVYGGMCVV